MWPLCTANNPLWLLLPFLVGLLTGWWAWAQRPAAGSAAGAEVRIYAPGPVQPVATPAAPSLTVIGIPAASGAPDDLLEIKGVGPALNNLLNSLGVTRFDQIADWSSEHIAIVDSHLGAFRGRIERDSWVTQAGLLAAGKMEEFEHRFGPLGSDSRM
jgi:predicted flap endonuclease-1-like 5' DNA nuclease